MHWLLLAIALVGALYVRIEVGRIRSARALLGLLSAEQRSDAERLYSIDGIVGRLIPELQWAELTSRRVTIVVIRWYVAPERVTEVAAVLAGLTRAHECVYRTGQREVALSLSAPRDLDVLHAIRRLMSMTTDRCGTLICDVGSASFPDDATTIDGLFEAGRARMRPWQEWADAAEHAPWEAAVASGSKPEHEV